MKAQKLAVFQKSSCRKIAIALTDPVGDQPNSQSAPGYNNYRFRVMQKEEAAQISGGSCSLCSFS